MFPVSAELAAKLDSMTLEQLRAEFRAGQDAAEAAGTLPKSVAAAARAAAAAADAAGDDGERWQAGVSWLPEKQLWQSTVYIAVGKQRVKCVLGTAEQEEQAAELAQAAAYILGDWCGAPRAFGASCLGACLGAAAG